MINENKIVENLAESKESKINSSLCYKCKKHNAIVHTREKSCKDCFIKLVEYTFKNTLREKCLFKSKTANNILYGDKITQKYIKTTKEICVEAKEKEGTTINKTEDYFEKKSDKDDIHVKKIKENEKYVYEKKKNIITFNKQKKSTAIAFSGGICSCFLLYLFVKYLKNAKKKKEYLFLMNEHSIFNEIIFVDIYEDEKYIYDLIYTIKKIFESLEEEDVKKDINENEKKEQVLLNNDNFTVNNRVFKIKINKVYFVVLKNNYFINETYKDQFTMNYNTIKKEKNYYLNYINEIIIYNNIIKYCLNENIKYVLFGNNANSISSKSFLHTVLGNGINLPLCTSYIDNRYIDIHFIKPLKDLLNKEIYIYCFYKNINYLTNTLFDGNILYKSINNILSNLDNKNNTTSIINNTVNNMINLLNYFNNDKNKYNNTSILQKKYCKDFEEEFSNKTNEILKNCNVTSCYICLGKKETEKEKNFIKKMDKIQLTNIKEMKYTNLICSTCLSIFSSNSNFLSLYNIFFHF